MRPSECTLLYLEDEIIIALDTTQTLEEMGFASVHTVHNLRRAQAVAREARPDFALLDVNIAGEGLSLEFGRSLMAQGVGVVFASGYNRREMEAEHRGMWFVEKPLSTDEITDAFVRLGLVTAPAIGHGRARNLRRGDGG